MSEIRPIYREEQEKKIKIEASIYSDDRKLIFVPYYIDKNYDTPVYVTSFRLFTEINSSSPV